MNNGHGDSWLVGDIVKTELMPNAYEIWHDRAYSIFLRTWTTAWLTFDRWPTL